MKSSIYGCVVGSLATPYRRAVELVDAISAGTTQTRRRGVNWRRTGSDANKPFAVVRALITSVELGAQPPRVEREKFRSAVKPRFRGFHSRNVHNRRTKLN